MNVPVMRNRTGSSRADFVGVDPRQPSPSPSDLLGRRFSELSAEQQLLHDWAKQLSEFRGFANHSSLIKFVQSKIY